VSLTVSPTVSPSVSHSPSLFRPLGGVARADTGVEAGVDNGGAGGVGAAQVTGLTIMNEVLLPQTHSNNDGAEVTFEQVRSHSDEQSCES
jgi:hypothetical protein